MGGAGAPTAPPGYAYGLHSGVATTYDVDLGLIGKRVVDFQLLLNELFSLIALFSMLHLVYGTNSPLIFASNSPTFFSYTSEIA